MLVGCDVVYRGGLEAVRLRGKLRGAATVLTLSLWVGNCINILGSWGQAHGY